jgi:hypothetical protein
MANSRERQRKNKRSPSVGTFDRLEERCLLAPVPAGTGVGTVWYDGSGATITAPQFDGFYSIRLISTQTGRIEVDPTGAFGNDVFVVSRGTPAPAGGILPVPVNAGDVAGNIYRVDPYAVNAFGTSPVDNRQFFANIPSGGSAFGGYENWHDITFNVTGSFNGVNGGPTIYVSTLDSATTPGINPRNAIYGFNPDGTPVAPATATGLAMYSDEDTFHPGILDSQLGAIAIAPGDTFGQDLFIFDVACDNEVGTTCDAGDGNTIFRVRPIDVFFGPNPIDLDNAPFPLNDHVEGLLTPLATPPLNNDIDVRAMVFDPNRGIILGGQFGEQAVQLYGGMFVASSDFEGGDTGVSRILHFPSLGTAPIDVLGTRTVTGNTVTVTPPTVQTTMIGDMTFDPVGHFGGGIFYTDYITRSVVRLIQDPTTGTYASTPFLTNFNVLTPTQFTPAQPAGVTPAQAYRDAFSISFSPNGEIMFVSDRDGVWAFYANSLAHHASGVSFGLTDIRELRVPYTGQGFAAAVVDSGVDGQHLGFQNTVVAGLNPAFPSGGNFDPQFSTESFHGTAVAGIIHQIVPDAIIVPATVDYTGIGLGNTQDFYESVRFVRDNPFVDDPRTPFINESVDNPATPQDDRTRIVSVNMSLGIRAVGDPDGVQNTEHDAFLFNQTAVLALKAIFQDYRRMGIVPVGAAGNDGALPTGMAGAIVPAIMNEVVEVTAAYPWGPEPPLVGPPLDIGATDRCELDAEDELAFPGKIPAFANRNITTDFAAPGVCVSTYGPSFFVGELDPAAVATATGPLLQQFAGTSAAAPIITGSFVFGFDVLSTWAAIAAGGGTISFVDSAATTADDKTAAVNQYLTRDLLVAPGGAHIAPAVLGIGAAASHLGAYANQDGINAILQWTAIPREDVNIGESNTLPEGTDDSVVQRRLRDSDRFRTYSHVNLANFLSSVEGSIALNFFADRPAELAQMASKDGDPSLITAFDIDAYVADVTNTPTERAMAHLLGGADRVGRLNRLRYLDIVQDEHVDGGIRADAAAFAALRDRILPDPTDFAITNRTASADQGYALDSTPLRNYQDLKYYPRGSLLAPTPKGKLKKKSPAQFTFGGHLTFLPMPGQPELPQVQGQRYLVLGHAGDNIPGLPHVPGEDPPDDPPGEVPGGDVLAGSRTADNFATLDEGGTEFLYHTDPSGHLIEYTRGTDGGWQPTDLTAATGGPNISSDLVAIDRTGDGSRAIFGLTPDGHVARYEFAGGAWVAEDVTESSGLPTIQTSLTGLVLHRTTGDTTVLYGLNASGQLIEYRGGRFGWTSRNISAIKPGAALESKLVAWGEVYRGKTERIFIFGATADGHVIQYLMSGKRWSRTDLSVATNPTLAAESLVVLAPPSAGGSPSLFGLDAQGSLWRYAGALFLGWESIGASLGGPALRGELSVQSTGAGTTHLFGVARDGRLIQYSGQSGNWSWSEVATAAESPGGDVSASTNYRSVYSEMVDGALAEFWLGDTWNMRRLDPGAATPGEADGSSATSLLISLALASR